MRSDRVPQATPSPIPSSTPKRIVIEKPGNLRLPGRVWLRRRVPARSALAALALCLSSAQLTQVAAAALPLPKPAPPEQSSKSASKKGADSAKSDAKPEKNAYDFYLPGPDGKDVPLSNFKGKFIVIVNLARKSSYNEQLPALIKLNDTYKDKGIVVIGVPSNDFGAAEPGTDAEIQKAYADAKVDFPVMAVSKLSGDDALPIAGYLTKSKGAPAGGPVHWNYTKFVIDKKGNVIARLSPDVAPDSPEMLSTLDQILDGTYKPPKKGGGDKPGEGDDDDE